MDSQTTQMPSGIGETQKELASSSRRKATRVTSRKSETEDERDARLAVEAQRVALKRSNETQDERKQRLAAMAERDRLKRMSESEQNRRERLAVKAERARMLRAKAKERKSVGTQDELGEVQKRSRLQDSVKGTPMSSATTAHQDESEEVENYLVPSCSHDLPSTSSTEFNEASSQHCNEDGRNTLMLYESDRNPREAT
ncbi:unnamed protein product, partial [Cylicocyclus nassatus]